MPGRNSQCPEKIFLPSGTGYQENALHFLPILPEFPLLFSPAAFYCLLAEIPRCFVLCFQQIGIILFPSFSGFECGYILLFQTHFVPGSILFPLLPAKAPRGCFSTAALCGSPWTFGSARRSASGIPIRKNFVFILPLFQLCPG